MSQPIKHFFVQTFVSELAIAPKNQAVESLHEAILHRLARWNVMPSHPAVVRAFSVLRVFKPRASETSIPPYFAFHLQKVVELIP